MRFLLYTDIAGAWVVDGLGFDRCRVLCNHPKKPDTEVTYIILDGHTAVSLAELIAEECSTAAVELRVYYT